MTNMSHLGQPIFSSVVLGVVELICTCVIYHLTMIHVLTVCLENPRWKYSHKHTISTIPKMITDIHSATCSYTHVMCSKYNTDPSVLLVVGVVWGSEVVGTERRSLLVTEDPELPLPLRTRLASAGATDNCRESHTYNTHIILRLGMNCAKVLVVHAAIHLT